MNERKTVLIKYHRQEREIAQCCVYLTIHTFVFPSLSLPAKSTKFSLDTVYLALDWTLDLVWKQQRLKVNPRTQCETIVRSSELYPRQVPFFQPTHRQKKWAYMSDFKEKFKYFVRFRFVCILAICVYWNMSGFREIE